MDSSGPARPEIRVLRAGGPEADGQLFEVGAPCLGACHDRRPFQDPGPDMASEVLGPGLVSGSKIERIGDPPEPGFEPGTLVGIHLPICTSVGIIENPLEVLEPLSLGCVHSGQRLVEGRFRVPGLTGLVQCEALEKRTPDRVA